MQYERRGDGEERVHIQCVKLMGQCWISREEEEENGGRT